MDILEFNAQNPEKAKSDVQIQNLFGWASIDSIKSYMNHNSEIMAKAAYDRHKNGGDCND